MTSFFTWTETKCRTLAKGDPVDLCGWMPGKDATENRSLFFCLVTIFFGCGVYGVTIGLWNGLEMAVYVGIKFPLIIFLTLGLNGLLNVMLAQVLGSGLSFRATLSAQVISFSIFALIVGSLSPVTAGMALDLPGPDSPRAPDVHRTLILFHTGLIAFAGVVSNYKLLRLLRNLCPDPKTASVTLLSWLAGNLFLGAQISYLLRPIFGQPGIEIQFLRPDFLTGNFYESVLWAITRLIENS